MGLFSNKADGGLMDMIRCDEQDFLIWKWRPAGNSVNTTNKENAIRWGSSLRVKDGEVAVFVYKQKDGVMQDFIEGPFDQTIKTANFPILSSIVGLAYAGGTPFQAEVYYVNLAGNIQIKFGIPYFDIFDPRFIDFGVPTSVRGSITFNITDYKSFIKLNRLINFELDTFKSQIKDAVTKYIKGVVANVPVDLQIPVVQIERKILEINDWVAQRIKDSLEADFGVNIKRLDISAIEVDKEAEGYIKIRQLTADITERKTVAQANIDINTVEAQSEVNIKNLMDTQSINAGNMEETLRMQREEMQRAQKLQTESANLETHKLNIQTEAQKEVLKAAADSLGVMGNMNLGGGGGGGGMNPAGMMMGMSMGGAMGNQMSNMMGNMGNTMNPQNNAPPQNNLTPPTPPTTQYFVAVNGQKTGPFNMQQLQQLVANGQLQNNTSVWKQGMPSWAEAGQILELQNLFGALPPAMPPPINP
jgi:membrane protease subunit (stomatin/prohibitin family)